jgi:hypothetical protein
VRRALLLLAAALAAAAGPAWAGAEAEERGAFSRTLAPAELGAAEIEQQAPVNVCDLPPKDAAFKALGRNPGPVAIAHHADGRAIESAALAATAPFPQLFPVGEYAFEPNVGVTASGAILVDAVKCAGDDRPSAPAVLRSTDQGQTFRDVSPRLRGVPTHPTTQDPFLYVDKHTSRVFSTDIDNIGGCQPLSLSDDAGTTWTETRTGCSLADHANIFTGSAPPGGARPSGYPNVVYYCAIDAGAVSGIGKATSCLKSTDGGLTAVRTGEPAYVPDPAIAAADPVACDGGTGPGFADASGTIYLPRGWCGRPYLAMSRDEGASWTRVEVSDLGMGTQNDDETAGFTVFNHEAGVRVDAGGTIYYVWVAHDRLPYLVTSHDGGSTWSRPLMFGPPGVRQAWDPAIDIAPSGRIAIAYLASTNAPAGPFADGPEELAAYKDATWNGYITMSDDPSSPDPTFFTASVNAPSHPFVKAVPGDGGIPCGQLRCGPEFDFIDLKLGPDGTPWAAFVDACGGGKACISESNGAAVVARLVTPGSGAVLDAAAHGLLGPARVCASRRHFVIRVHRPRFVRLVSATVFLGGRRVAVRRGGRLTARVDLRGLPPGRFTVTIRARTASGRTLTDRRRYRTCSRAPRRIQLRTRR